MGACRTLTNKSEKHEKPKKILSFLVRFGRLEITIRLVMQFYDARTGVAPRPIPATLEISKFQPGKLQSNGHCFDSVRHHWSSHLYGTVSVMMLAVVVIQETLIGSQATHQEHRSVF